MQKSKSKNIIAALVGVAAIALLVGVTHSCAKQTEVGIINFVSVQKKAKVYLYAAEQQKKYDEQVQARVLKDKDFIKLQEDGKNLTAQQNTMPAAEFERKSAALQARALKINERYRAEFERNAMASQMAMKNIEQQIAEAIEATAQKTGAKILLPVNTILYAAEKVDLTDAFVKELDKRVETVEYPNPSTLQ